MYQINRIRQTAITPPNISESRRFRTLIRTISEFITGNRSVVQDNVRKNEQVAFYHDIHVYYALITITAQSSDKL